MSTEDYYKNGIMKDLLHRRLITPTVYRYGEIYANVQHLRSNGHNKTQAVKLTSDTCRVCEDTVWKAIKTMEK